MLNLNWYRGPRIELFASLTLKKVTNSYRLIFTPLINIQQVCNRRSLGLVCQFSHMISLRWPSFKSCVIPKGVITVQGNRYFKGVICKTWQDFEVSSKAIKGRITAYWWSNPGAKWPYKVRECACTAASDDRGINCDLPVNTARLHI